MSYDISSGSITETQRVEWVHVFAYSSQKEGKWQVVAEPSIILTQKNNPDVPFKILSIANNYDY